MSALVNPVDVGMEHYMPGFSAKIDGIESNLGGKLALLQADSLSTLQQINLLPTFDHMKGMFSHIASSMSSYQPFQQSSKTATTAAASNEDLFEESPVKQVFKLCVNHKSVSSMWHEWHGMGAFLLAPYPLGGLQALEQDKTSAWRKGFSSGQAKQYSRT